MTAIPVFIQEWTFDKVLGSGGFGIVQLWTHKNGKKIGTLIFL